MLHSKITDWYENNSDWIDDHWLEVLMTEHGFDVTESSLDLMIPDDELEELYFKNN